MTGGRWQSYATWKLAPETHRLWALAMELREDDNNAAAFRLHLRDQHDEGKHSVAVQDCKFCERGMGPE